MTSIRALAVALATAGILGPASAHAAGFAIFEQGARAMGFAGAFTAQANDPCAIFHNAAGIAFLKGKQLYLGGTLIRPSSTLHRRRSVSRRLRHREGGHRHRSSRPPRTTPSSSASAWCSASACTRPSG